MPISGLYYKHVTIVNDDSSVISKWSFKLIDDLRVVIYDCHRFILQATGSSTSLAWYHIISIRYHLSTECFQNIARISIATIPNRQKTVITIFGKYHDNTLIDTWLFVDTKWYQLITSLLGIVWNCIILFGIDRYWQVS